MGRRKDSAQGQRLGFEAKELVYAQVGGDGDVHGQGSSIHWWGTEMLLRSVRKGMEIDDCFS